MKHSLQLKVSQQLALTPQLQQSIRLLQLSTLELNQEIKQLVQDNPLLELEEEEEETLEESASNIKDTGENWDQNEQHESFGKPHEDSHGEERQIISKEESLTDYLNEQLSLAKLSEKNKQLVIYLIGNLTDEGFLSDSVDDLLTSLPGELEITVEEIEFAIKALQDLAPPGVGARDLSECLALQLKVMPDDVPFKHLAIAVVTEQLNYLASRDYVSLKKKLKCDDNTLREIQKLVKSLNPRPGSAFNVSETRYIIPDVVVKKINSRWVAQLNFEAKPKIRINQFYADILQNNRGENSQTIKDQLTDAKWFIKNVEQRYETILRVSQAIVDEQYKFFDHGELGMRPLVLREIAEKLDLHESTISRVTNQKFMMTPKGIYELKYFFGSHVGTQSGDTYSSTAIRALIKTIIDEEDKTKPVSDSQVSKLLSSQGIIVARRTVAKYREAMQILPVNLRKDI